MSISKIKAVFPCPIEKIWSIVTNLQDCSWRSDLRKIEVLSETKFVEYTKNGYATAFTVTKMNPYQLWEFDMENSNMKGRWTGIFSYDGNHTIVDFTEEVTAKNIIMKPFAGIYLKKQQKRYIEDLRKRCLQS